jgi:hypothetical protein
MYIHTFSEASTIGNNSTNRSKLSPKRAYDNKEVRYPTTAKQK